MLRCPTLPSTPLSRMRLDERKLDKITRTIPNSLYKVYQGNSLQRFKLLQAVCFSARTTEFPMKHSAPNYPSGIKTAPFEIPSRR